jgi:hypothetical protein
MSSCATLRAHRRGAASAGFTALAWGRGMLVAVAHFDPTYVSRVESGRINLRWGTLQRFLRALDVTVADLGAELERLD